MSTTADSPSWFDQLAGFADRAADVYSKIQQGRNSGQTNVNTQTVPGPDPARRYSAAPEPWYKQAWVIPAALGTVVVVVVLVLFRRK